MKEEKDTKDKQATAQDAESKQAGAKTTEQAHSERAKGGQPTNQTQAAEQDETAGKEEQSRQQDNDKERKDESVAESPSVKVELDHDVTINGVRYPAGKQELPKEVAEEAKRINDDYTRYQATLHQNNGTERDLGKIKGNG
ncbi:MAG: hypothetical protein LC803_09355 [Acidobacteria bacterium]|nr:hypothetical protein [Acidobacteriota bacterium]